MNYRNLKSPLSHWNLTAKRVFVRADLNVPLKDGHILDESRLYALIPTLDYLRTHNAQITVATHLGNPKTTPDAEDVAPLRAWFKHHGYTITLLENLRSMPGEQRNATNHQTAEQLAQHLAHNQDYYINDAFGALHRDDTSLTLVPALFDKEHKGIGFLVEKELHALQPLVENVQRPYYVFLGGGKQEDKLEIAQNIVQYCDGLFLMPALSTPFVQRSNDPRIQDIVHTLQQSQKVFLPLDYSVSNNAWNSPFYTKNSSEITEKDFIIAIGEDTVEQWKKYIAQARTIFFNGPMGKLDVPETTETLRQLLHTIAHSNALIAIGGGDSVAVIHAFGLEQKFKIISTGGGATLTYVSHQKLPALDAL